MALKQLLKASTTTTVNIARIRGLSLEILALLYSREGAYVPDIADVLGKSRTYVRQYLHRLLKYGCVDRYDGWGWKITPLGIDIILYNDSIQYNNNNTERNTSVTLPLQKRNSSVTVSSHAPHTTASSRQLNLSLYSDNPDISDPERAVVVVLAEHYEQTGEKYRYYSDMYDFCEQMGISSIGVNHLIAKLKQEGVIYVMWMRDLEMWKIGLKKDFVERLQYC